MFNEEDLRDKNSRERSVKFEDDIKHFDEIPEYPTFSQLQKNTKKTNRNDS